MKKRELCLLSLLSFFVGMVTGFMISPIKKGVGNNSGNNNGNNTYNYYYDEEQEEEIKQEQ